MGSRRYGKNVYLSRVRYQLFFQIYFPLWQNQHSSPTRASLGRGFCHADGFCAQCFLHESGTPVGGGFSSHSQQMSHCVQVPCIARRHALCFCWLRAVRGEPYQLFLRPNILSRYRKRLMKSR